MLGKLSLTAKLMPVIALVALFVSAGASSVSRVNGKVVSCSHTDVLALGVALGCVVGGGVLIRRALRPADVVERQVTTPHLVIGLVLLAAAVVHALRGIGTIGGPCG